LASQPNEHGLEPLRSLLRTCRDACVRFVDQETPSTGVDSSACFLAEGAGSDPFRNRCPTRLESRLRRRYASSVAEGLVSPLRACAQGYCAQGVPTKLAPAHATRVAASGERFSSDASMGAERPEHPTSAVRCDARAHPQELSILLRARLPPLSALPADVAACAAFADRFSSVMTARVRSHAFCSDACDRSLGRRSREAHLSSGRRLMRWCRTRVEPGDNWSTPGLTDVRHGSRPQSEGSGCVSRL
jgi:hypothetical protein